MILCCSPTKTMKSVSLFEASKPLFLEEASQLVKVMKTKNLDELINFYKCNEKIARQNMERFDSFDLNAKNNAGLCFDGLQFKRMLTQDWMSEEWEYAQQHLRIMSGLYGLLRVKDGISEYRLDVENPLVINGMSLSEFWQPKVCDILKDELILDCCSKEYSALLPEHKINVTFYVEKQGKLKIEATAAKMARGSFIHYCVKNKVKDLQSAHQFAEAGFMYREDLSDKNRLVFVKGEEE